jgi:hypothetical protein
MKYCYTLSHYRAYLYGTTNAPVSLMRRFDDPLKYSSIFIARTIVTSTNGGLHMPNNLNKLKLKPIPSDAVTPTRCSRFSSTQASSSSFSPWSWWKERQERNDAEKYRQNIAAIAEREVWTLGPMLKEVEDVTKSWTAKLIDNKESRAVKHMKKVLEGLISVIGKDAQADRVVGMSKKEKLQTAIAAETTVEEINILIKHVQANEKIHRIVRKRKIEGKPLPATPDAMQQLARIEFPKILTKDEKTQMKKFQMRTRKKM